MKKLNKKIIYKLVIIIVIVLFVDLFSGKIFGKLYQSCKSGICSQENYIMNNTNQDLLVFGSSRAAYHYIPSILQDTIGMSVYNCGREGSGIYYHYGVLLSTLKRYNPKVIVLDIDYRDIYKAEGIFGTDILKEHAPFYHQVSHEFDSLLILPGKKEAIKLQSNLYRYNSKVFKIITGNLVRGRDNELGFRANNGVWKKSLTSLNQKDLKVDENKILTIKKFIEKVQKHKIKLILTVSPYYKKTIKGLYEPLVEVSNEKKLKY
ncbi:MAG: hypothetical protein M0D53_12935 [Flavobacterium sp. JAD_PAG50586_2]|nr:MAG: hypothetical protein M0D53_12935 [Flavobacterium sp. JAD_PAG50586_2]